MREFGYLLAGFLLVAPLLSRVLKTWFGGVPFEYWFGWPLISLAVIGVNLLAIPVIDTIFRIATLFAHAISWVMMRMILAIFFYLVMTPISFAMRMVGKDMLDQKINREASSYWHQRPPQRPRADYERLF